MAASKSGAPVVLIVDTHAKACAQRAEHLRRTFGFRTVTADNAADAVSMAEAWRPTVVVIDLLNLRRPGTFDGWAVARRLKSGPNADDFSLIAVGHYTSANDRRQAAALGCVRLLVKPSVKLLGQVVRESLDERRLSMPPSVAVPEPVWTNQWVVPSPRAPGKRWTEEEVFREYDRRQADSGPADLMEDKRLLAKLSHDSGWHCRELVVAIGRRGKQVRDPVAGE